jgi:hypothetical protein
MMCTQGFRWLVLTLVVAAMTCGCRTAELRVEHPQTGVRLTCKVESVDESMK